MFKVFTWCLFYSHIHASIMCGLCTLCARGKLYFGTPLRRLRVAPALWPVAWCCTYFFPLCQPQKHILSLPLPKYSLCDHTSLNLHLTWFNIEPNRNTSCPMFYTLWPGQHYILYCTVILLCSTTLPRPAGCTVAVVPTSYHSLAQSWWDHPDCRSEGRSGCHALLDSQGEFHQHLLSGGWVAPQWDPPDHGEVIVTHSHARWEEQASRV